VSPGLEQSPQVDLVELAQLVEQDNVGALDVALLDLREVGIVDAGAALHLSQAEPGRIAAFYQELP
jgi:hypothetical protein